MNMARNSISKHLAAAAGCVALAASASAAAFTPGNLVVLRVGDGSTVLASNVAAAVFLDEFTTAGTFVQSIALPTANSGANLALTLGGLNNSEGALNLSNDGQYLVLGGYNATPGTTGVVAGASSRVIARIDAAGNVDTSTSVTDGFTGGRIASVASDNGTRFWSAGAGTGGGLRYSASLGASTSTSIAGTPNNLRVAQIFQGQMYSSVSFNPGWLGIASIGTGVPTTTGQTTTILPGFHTTPTPTNHLPLAYFFQDANTVYMVDSQAAANGGGLQKWTLSAGTWTQSTTPFPYVSTTAADGLTGLTGTVGGANVTLYATSADATNNSLLKWTSTDSGATGTFSTLTTAGGSPNSNVFRGVAFAPATVSAVENWWVLNE